MTAYGYNENTNNLLQLSEIVNGDKFPGLFGILNNRDIANKLLIARYSDLSIIKTIIFILLLNKKS